MTIEIWVRLEDLETLKKIQGRWKSEPDIAVQYSTNPGDDGRYCVHMDYDEFVRLLDNELLIKL